MKQPTKRIISTNPQVAGLNCRIESNTGTAGGATATVVGEEYILTCEGKPLAVGDADKLSEYALYVLGASSVSHDYDLRAYDERYRNTEEIPHPGEGGGVK